MIEKYYEEELRYLYDSGKEFAQAHPDRAQFLNVDAVGDRDPYVERLFEGFAFLTGRIREKLDDSFPELTEGMINLLWPHFQHTIPSLTLIECRPRKGHLQETKILPRGSELLSNPVGPDAVICKFITTHDVRMSPIALASLDKEVDTRGKAALTFNFEIDSGVKWQNLNLDPLRLYLHAELPTALALHQLLLRHIVSATVTLDGNRAVTPINPATLATAGGFGPNESLLPGDSRAFRGYELLLEYFVYLEKFLFIDFSGFKAVQPIDPPPSRFSLKLTFDCDFPQNKPFGIENFRLFCSPAVNIFKQDTEPVINSGRSTEYLVRASSSSRSYTTHSIISIIGVDRKSGERYVYEPFHTFKTIGNKKIRSYTTHYRPGLSAARDLWIAIGGKQAEEGTLGEENLSIEAWCTNDILPREELREGSINKGGQNFPDFVMFTNITRPTLPCPPPSSQEYHWVFLSHLGATYSSFSTADSLKSFLKLYEWSNSEGRARRIEAISDVQMKPVEGQFGGSIVRGIEMAVSIQEAEFADSGDLHLFGEVLKEFLAQYVSINSFLELVIIRRPSGKELRWNSLKGTKWPI